METIKIRHFFNLPEGVRETVDLQCDAQTLKLVGNIPDVLPSWTKLDFYQCLNCPLMSNTHSYCPLTANLVTIVEKFKGLISYSTIHVDIMTAERFIMQDTTVQRV